MPLFLNSEEAKKSVDAGFESAWTEFSTKHGINPKVNQQAYDITKTVFHTGYAYGVKFISEKILTEIENHKKQS